MWFVVECVLTAAVLGAVSSQQQNLLAENLTISDIEKLRFSWEKHCLVPVDDWSHRRRLDHECVIHFFHIHKTGGTTMCNTATQNKFRVTGHNNCNTPVDVSLRDQRNRDLGIAQQYILEHNLSFVGQEYALFQPNISTNRFLHMVTVRHPVDRLISHLHHTMCEGTQEDAELFMKKQNCTTIKNVREATLSDIILDPCFHQSNPGLYAITTNFYINMMMNCLRHCTESDLISAMNKLHFFSVIMITDTPDEYDRY